MSQGTLGLPCSNVGSKTIRKSRTNYRIRRLHLSRLLLVQDARHPSPRITRTLGKELCVLRRYLLQLRTTSLGASACITGKAMTHGSFTLAVEYFLRSSCVWQLTCSIFFRSRGLASR